MSAELSTSGDDFSVNGGKITDLAAGVDPTDAVTVSQLASGTAPTGAAGGVLDGTFPNPGLAAGVAGGGLAEALDVLSVNVDGSTIEISSDSLRVKDGGITAAKLAAALTPGLPELVYRYTVTGSDKASIDTGTDTPDAGTNDWTGGDLLEVFIYGRTDESTTSSVVTMTINGDTSAVYDRAFVNNTNTTVTGSNSVGQTGFALGIAAANAAAGTFAHLAFWCQNYTGTVGNKQFDSLGGTLGQTAALATIINQNFTWRPASPAAITSLKIIPATAAKKFKVGTQLLIYKRRSA